MKADSDFFVWCHFFIRVATKINSLEKGHPSHNKMCHCLWLSSPKMSFFLGFSLFCFQQKETITKTCTAAFLVNLNLSVFSPFCQPCSSLPKGLGHGPILLPALPPEAPNLSCCSQPHKSSPSTSLHFIYLTSDHPAETSTSQREHEPFPKGTEVSELSGSRV